ncbi:MAG: hypothetical protein PVJ57_10870 [Phycisphaerae bacterium]
MTDVVPEHWESPAAEPPIQPRPIGLLLFLPAAVGQFVLPGRLGPRLACSSVFLAILVHLAALVLGTGLVLIGLEPDELELRSVSTANMTTSEIIRLPLVFAVESMQTTASGPNAMSLVIGLVAGHVGCWFLARGLVPIVASGGTRRRTFVRALKLTFWSSLSFVPFAAGLSALLAARYHYSAYEWDEELLIVVGWLAWGVYWLHLLVWLGSRVHRLSGTEAEKRPPCCTGCGYRLTGLPVDGTCPECGLAVGVSLPGIRGTSADASPDARRQPAWATARGPIRRCRAWFGTSWRILRQPHFFRTLAVHAGQVQAVRFAIRTCWLVAVWTMLVAAVPVGLAEADDSVGEEFWPAMVLLLSMLLLGTLLITTFVGGLVALAACWFGFRDPGRTTTATGYAAALFLPVGLLLPLAPAALAVLHMCTGWKVWVDELPQSGLLLADGIALVVAFTPAVWAFVVGLRRYFVALQDVRHAMT